MSAAEHQLAVIASTIESSALCVTPAGVLTIEELANTPRYDIKTSCGTTLWYCTTLADASRLILMRRELPALYPEWQTDLVVHPLDDAPAARLLATSPEGLTVASIAGHTEQLQYAGGNLGLGDAPIFIDVRTPTRRADITLEKALKHLDLFEPKTRGRLVEAVEFWFDCKLTRGAA